MQNQRYVYPIDLTNLNIEVEVICEKLRISKAEAIRNAIEFYSEYVKGLKVIELRRVPKKQAEKEILNYIKKRGKAWTSEIADDLRLDVVLVNDILKKLAEEGEIE
ncbi:MAG: winged helix-turn-helix domain-containing protein [Candidatus Aenigmarchaeota archaeon]|nr:winged helix-turn-helix domain-containing protein [Candidatus Aenigmarchaeota archaeon]